MARYHTTWFSLSILIAVAACIDVNNSWAQVQQASGLQEMSPRVQSDAVIHTVVRKQRSTIMNFYKHQLKYHPQMQGSIKIRLSVKENGRVGKIQVLEDTVKNRVLTNYIKKRAESWEFGKLNQVQVVDLIFPFTPRNI